MPETEGCGSGERVACCKMAASGCMLSCRVQPDAAVLIFYKYAPTGARKVQPTAVERLRLVAVGFVCRYGDRFGQM